ncbi:MAG: hypothetical protein ACOZCO_05650 [Bacteroidota bacterium]
MKKIIVVTLLLTSVNGFSQETGELVMDKKSKRASTPGGELQLGMRTTGSLFSQDSGPGYGFGGQFRIKLGKQLNTEWFADYITSDIKGLGKRSDAHIGWSVMFYLKKSEDASYLNNRFVPYLIAGHCFDYTQVRPFNTASESNSDQLRERWSSATQAGLGLMWNYSQHFNLTLTSQYMMHLGNALEYDVQNINGKEELVFIENGEKSTLEGHLLITMSMNVRIADLW